jgi:hypothetical protein
MKQSTTGGRSGKSKTGMTRLGPAALRPVQTSEKGKRKPFPMLDITLTEQELQTLKSWASLPLPESYSVNYTGVIGKKEAQRSQGIAAALANAARQRHVLQSIDTAITAADKAVAKIDDASAAIARNRARIAQVLEPKNGHQ